MLVGVRERLVRNRTQNNNTIRGYAAEFGITASKGLIRIEQLLVRAASDETIPALARDLFSILGKEYGQLQARLEKIEARLMAWHRADACSQRLAQIPGIGPIGASMLVMKTPAPETFRSSRHFAAWLGLTPKDHSTAGKSKLGGIARAGDEALRSVLVVGVHLASTSCPTARNWLALAYRSTEAQATEAGGGSASQQKRSHRLETHGERRALPNKPTTGCQAQYRIQPATPSASSASVLS
jgi:transposase